MIYLVLNWVYPTPSSSHRLEQWHSKTTWFYAQYLEFVSLLTSSMVFLIILSQHFSPWQPFWHLLGVYISYDNLTIFFRLLSLRYTAHSISCKLFLNVLQSSLQSLRYFLCPSRLFRSIQTCRFLSKTFIPVYS